MLDAFLRVFTVIALFGFLWGIGIVCLFYPQVIQRAILTAPQPKFRFIPRPDAKIFGMGGREYYGSKRYIITLRITGAGSLMMGCLLLLLFLGVIPSSP